MSEHVELSTLDPRYEGYRLRDDAREARLLASIAERGIEEALEGVDTSQGRWHPGARVLLVEVDAYQHFVASTYLNILEKTETTPTFTTSTGVDIAAGRALLFPVLDCEIVLRPELRLPTSQHASLRLRVNEVAGASALPPLASDRPTGFPVFEQRPIWNIEPDWSREVRYGRNRQGQSRRQGRTSVVFTDADRSRTTHRFRTLEERAEGIAQLRMFQSRRGRLRTFWHLDQSQNWTCVGIDATGGFVALDPTRDFARVPAALSTEWIGLVMSDGSYYVREVGTIQEVMGVYRFTLVTMLPTGLDFNDVVRIARARLTRNERDDLRERWTTVGRCEMEHRFIETLKEDVYSTS